MISSGRFALGPHSYPWLALASVRAVTDGQLLPVEAIDLESLVLARNDTHPDGDWWFDPRSGESLYLGLDDDADLPALVAGVHVVIPTAPQPPSDVEDFLAAVDDEETAVRLAGVFRRRGGLRRFRDEVARSPLADRWQDFTMRRESLRAIDWLLERDLVDPASARRVRDELDEPPA